MVVGDIEVAQGYIEFDPNVCDVTSGDNCHQEHLPLRATEEIPKYDITLLDLLLISASFVA